ncbi:hypothetical protein [Paenibacillus tyrfis]|uniref:hypothetical protein n=1 Tax=Paenibacillus tyrfis TaxID=1501230 RepID=UPI0020A13D5B|nr:hypothetical protein [Paenibacillus tyrfis]MCP1311616.1 hypothetical protein [Paenibacillus tyrfis]
MAEIRGKFITLLCSLMGVYKTQQEEANEFVQLNTGKGFKELEAEGWYDYDIYCELMSRYRSASLSKDRAMVTLGQKIYPTIRSTMGLPESLMDNLLGFLKFNEEVFKASIRGKEVAPMKFLTIEEGEVIIQSLPPSDKYPELHMRLYEGVYLGILELCRVKEKKVEVLDNFTYRITWSL